MGSHILIKTAIAFLFAKEYFQTIKDQPMKSQSAPQLRDGDQCKVIAGTHAGKSGTVADINTSKTGHITITVVQANGVRFKTLGRNVEVTAKGKAK
jgi:ribosomal protein S4E